MGYSPASRHYSVLKKLFPVPVLQGDQDVTMDVEGKVLDRAEDLAKTLLNEIVPDTATDDSVVGTILLWEQAFGVPYDDTKTLSERRQIIAAKILSPSGLNQNYFYALAASFGYNIWPDTTIPYIRITKGSFKPFRVGISHVGDKLYDQTSGYSNVRWDVFGTNVETDYNLQKIFNDQQPANGELFFTNV